MLQAQVQRHHACNARVFGSVAHGDDQEGSDLDILIDPTSNTSLMDVAKIQVELEKLLGVAVDVLKPVSAEQMELARLRAQLARVTMERDILKKATAYFARESL